MDRKKGFKVKSFLEIKKMMNFDNLPSDIKNLIFLQNREWTSNKIKENKIRFNECLVELEYFIKETHDGYYDEEEEEEYNDLEYTFSKSLFDCMLEEKIEMYQEKELDLYFQEQVKIAEAEDKAFSQSAFSSLT